MAELLKCYPILGYGNTCRTRPGLYPDKSGDLWVTDAQYVAVKRALGGLQRQGKVIGFEYIYCRDDHFYDGRSERGYCWMSERRAQKWVRQQKPARAELVATFKQKMLAIGMQPSK